MGNDIFSLVLIIFVVVVLLLRIEMIKIDCKLECLEVRSELIKIMEDKIDGKDNKR